MLYFSDGGSFSIHSLLNLLISLKSIGAIVVSLSLKLSMFMLMDWRCTKINLKLMFVAPQFLARSFKDGL